MKRRLMYFVLGVLAGIIGGNLYLRYRSAPPPAASPATPSPATATKPLPEVAIQEGKTIDFSKGTPEIRDTSDDRAALEKAKKEMDEATKDVVFAPTKTATEGEPTSSPKAEPPGPDAHR